ncbi:glucose-1-phosphate cytidylyltransferase [Vibrio pectenicida]|uniref:Glucose-1-phosphate cytidylyltransferase n=1 Tax=Vibrio pectenicida TaxID=62763 RepID=A0A3R9E722_9VIBR|nr:glucose-1-phosphate cytidylyltransferase [Vibrio pectenicida]RSD27581.1 glucose-1-phosphate cytidylyltransferase [Vibrio pectenicida]
MKAVILAGGLGTRIAEETHLKPKPMIEIGGRPILWHIMNTYYSHGITDFIVCCGYKGYVIKEYFANYALHRSDVTIDLAENSITTHKKNSEPWKVTLIDTGEQTQTGGRIKRISEYIDSTFFLTYGDGVSDVDLTELLSFHKREKGLVTLTSVQPGARFGALEIEDNSVKVFEEKPVGDHRWINGGFFVCEPEVFSLIESDQTIWEREPMLELTKMGQLKARRHNGFWAAMDTLRDKNYLEELWDSGNAPWKIT